MEENIKQEGRTVLEHYLEVRGHRKTPERFAILDAIYSIEGHFSIDELSDQLAHRNFRVSRATLYNTLKLFLELRLVNRHHFEDGTKYEACYDKSDHCHQICTICGKVTEFYSKEINAAVQQVKLKRFRREGFTLYVYGVCSACQAQITKRLKGREVKDNEPLNQD